MKVSSLAVLLFAASVSLPALAIDRDNNPPGPVGGPGTNWENPPGPAGGPGASPDRRHFCKKHPKNAWIAITIHPAPEAALAPTGRTRPDRLAARVRAPIAAETRRQGCADSAA